jgi:glycosyltransferase EpsE
MNPRISILMPIFNCEKTLPEALESLLLQTYQNFKIILCDDGSTDNSFIVASEYIKKFKNGVLIKNEKNIRLAASLNRCLEFADTEYVARMDGDDTCSRYRFEKQIKFLDENAEYAIVSSSMFLFDESGCWGLWLPKTKPDHNTFKLNTPFSHPACMIRTRAIKDVSGYTVSTYLIRGQDYHLFYKMYKNGYRGFNILEPLYSYRDDQNALNRRTFENRYKSFIIRLEVLKGLNISYPLFYASFQLIKGLIPNFIFFMLRKNKYSNNLKDNLLKFRNITENKKN